MFCHPFFLQHNLINSFLLWKWNPKISLVVSFLNDTEEITSEILPPLKKTRGDFWGNNHEIDSNRFIDLTHLNIDLTGVAFKNGYQMTPQVDSCLIKWENVFVGFWVREILVKSMMLSHRNQKSYCKTTDWVPLLSQDLFLFYPWIYWL